MNYFNDKLNNIINLVRGDYLEIIPKINVGCKLDPQFIDFTTPEYTNYKVFFGLMEPNQAFEDSILYKDYLIDDSFQEVSDNFTEDGDLKIILKSEDTYCLHPGKYNYSIKIQKPDDYQIFTVINKCDFNIL